MDRNRGAGAIFAFAALAMVATIALLLPSTSAQTREGLMNPGLEGPGAQENGFTMNYLASAVGNSCPVIPSAAAGPVRTGNCSVDMGPPGPPTDWSAVSALKSFVELGNKVGDFRGFTAYENEPAGIDPASGAHYQFFFTVDSVGSGTPDRCIVQKDQVPTPSAAATGPSWLPVTFSDIAAGPTFSDSAITECAPGMPPDTVASLAAKYPAGQVIAFYAQLVAGVAPWPAGQDIYLDDLSARFQDNAGLLIAVTHPLWVNENTLSSDSYTVRLSGPPAAGETVTVTGSETLVGGAPQQVSLSPAVFSFTAADWDVPQDVTVTAVHDWTVQPDPHTTSIAYGATSPDALSPYASKAGPTLTVTIDEFDEPGLHQKPADIDLAESDVAATATYDILLGSAPLPGESVTITVSAGPQVLVDADPAMAGAQSTLTLTSSDWFGPHPVTVTVVDDLVDEADPHTAAISATAASNVPGSQYDNPTVDDVTTHIADDDPLVSVTATQDATEGGADGSFTLSRGPDTANAVTVGYAVGGAATPGTKYTALSGTLTIPAGAASAAVVVHAPSDGVNDPTQDVTLILDATGCGCAVDPAMAQLDIFDTDQPTVAIQWANDADEEAPSNGTFTLARTNADLAIDVAYTLSGASGSTYAADPASPLHFAVGQTVASLYIQPIDDAVDEPPKVVTATLAANAAYLVSATDGSADLQILGNDTPTVQVVALPSSASEDPAAAPGRFNVSRTTGHLDQALAVHFTVGGTATDGTDFPSLGVTTTIPVGASFVHLDVVPVDDGVNEPTETAVLTLAPDAAYIVAAGLGQATVQVLDFDATVVTITSWSDATENGATGHYTLERTHPDLAVDVAFALSGTAGATQYLLSSASPVHFAAGQASVNVAVTMLDDAVTHGNRTLTLTLLAGAAYGLGAPAAATITLHDVPPWPVCLPASQTVLVDAPFTLAASSGIPAYAWTAAGSSDPGPTAGAAFTASYATVGAHTVILGDADVMGQTATCTVAVVYPPLSCSPGWQSARVGETVALTATGGDGVYTWSAPEGVPAAGLGAAFSTWHPSYGAHDIVLSSADQTATCVVGIPAPRPYPQLVRVEPLAVGPAPPTAAIAVQQSCGSRTGHFDGSSSSDPDGLVVAWHWSFGDGTTASGPVAEHEFTGPGPYPVTLTVTDDAGGVGRDAVPWMLAPCAAGAATPVQPEAPTIAPPGLDAAGDQGEAPAEVPKVDRSTAELPKPESAGLPEPGPIAPPPAPEKPRPATSLGQTPAVQLWAFGGVLGAAAVAGGFAAVFLTRRRSTNRAAA